MAKKDTGFRSPQHKQQMHADNAADTADLTRDFYRSAVEDLPLLVNRFKPDGTILLANQAYCTFFGLTQSDFGKASIYKDLPQDRHAETRQNLLSLKKSSPVKTFENIVVRQDGVRRWIRWIDRALFNEKGSVEYFQSIGNDITDQKELALEMETAQQILQNAVDAVIRTDLHGTITFWNRGAENLYGYTPEEALGKPIRMLYLETDLPGLEEMISTLMDGKKVDPVELVMLDKFHQSVHILLSVFPVKDEGGDIVELVGFTKNITNLKEMEKRVVESERELSTLMGNLPGMAYRCLDDAKWTMTFVSEGCFALTGYTSKDLLQNRTLSFFDIIHPEDQQMVSGQIQNALRANHPFELTYRIVCKDKKVKWVWERGHAVHHAAGGPGHLEGFISDITEQVSAREEIEKLSRFPSENPNPVLRFTPDGKILYANAGSKPLLEKYQLEIGENMKGNWTEVISNAIALDKPMALEDRLGNDLYSFTFTPLQDLQYINAYGQDITAERHAQQDIHAHAAFLDTVMEQSPFAMLIADAQGIAIRTNDTLRKTLHLKDEQIIGKYNLLEDQNLIDQGVLPQVQAVFKNKQPARFTVPWKAGLAGSVDFSGGRDLWVDAAIFPVVDDEGVISNVICQWVDVSEQVHANQQLHEREQQYQSVVEDSPVMISRFLPDGTITFTNQGYSLFFLGQRTGMIGKNIYDFVREEYIAPTKDYLASFSRDDPVHMFDNRVKRFDGKLRWIRWTDRALFDESGNLSGFQAFGEDFTEQKEAEQLLAESEHSLSILMGNLPGIAYRGEAKGDLPMIFLSEGCLELTGYTPQEIIGSHDTSYEAITHPGDRKMVNDLIHDALKKGEGYELSYRIITKSGEERWVWEKGVGDTDETGKITTIEGFITDITERVHTEEALAESEARFRAFMENFPGNAYIKDAKLRYVFVNRATSEFGGVPQEEYIGRKTTEIFIEEFAAELEALDQSVLDDQVMIEKEGYYTPLQGQERYQRDIKFPILGLHGEKLVGGIALDLTAQKEAEKKVLEKAKFEQMLAKISADFLDMDTLQIDSGIHDALKQVGELLEIDRIRISSLDQANAMVGSHTWSRKKMMGVQDIYDIENYPWLFSAIRKGETMIWSIKEGLPDNLTKAEKELFDRTRICSLANIPIHFSGIVEGGMIFSDTRHADRFTPDLVETLHLFAQIISNAIALRDTELAIRQSESRYRSVVEDAPVFITRYDREGRITFSNQAFSNFFGLPISENTGTTIFDLIPADSQPAAKERVHSLSRKKPYFVTESKALRHDGQERWVRWTARALFDEKDRLETIQSFGIDITEQKLAGEKIAASERQFHSLFTEMDSAFALFEVIFNPKGGPDTLRIIDLNPAFEAMIGAKHDEIIGKPVYSVFPEFDPSWIDNLLDVALRNTPVERKIFFEKLGIHTHIRAYSPGQNQCAVILNDISEPEKLYRQVEIERDRAQRYLDLVQSIVIAMDENGKITLANSKACEILGYTEEELLGQNWFDTCLPVEIRDSIKKIFDGIIQNHEEFTEYSENPILTRKGDQPMIAWRNARLPDEQGNTIGILSAGEDITARKTAEKRARTLLDISSQLIEKSYDENTLKNVAAEVLSRIEAAQAITIWLYDEAEDTLSVKAMAGFSDPVVLNLTVNASSGIVGVVARTRKPILLNDAQKEKQFTSFTEFSPEMREIKSLICAPLVFHDKFLGAICIDNLQSKDAFDMEDVNLVESIANQLSGIVENAILFAEIQHNREELRALSKRLVEAHEEERRIVALDLHDHFGQLLTTLKLSLRAELFLRKGEAERRARLADVNEVVEELMDAAEDLSLQLRPAILDDLGLETAFEWHFNRLTNQTQVPIQSHINLEKGKRYPGTIEITLYRIMEESLANALQHGQPSMIRIDMSEKDNTLTMIIQDNGVGFDPAQLEIISYNHTGLTGVQERIRLLDGEVSIESEPGGGTIIAVSVPLK